MTVTHEPASIAQQAFARFMESAEIMGLNDPTLSEADTRAKLIDPIFRDCLGWPETHIHREEPVAKGFADYTFGTEYLWFHVEAKRTKPRFKFHMKSPNRLIAISGAHLLKNPQIKPLLEQTVKYGQAALLHRMCRGGNSMGGSGPFAT